MKSISIIAAALAIVPVPALAQTPAPAPASSATPAPAAPANAAPLNGDSPIEAIAMAPVGKASMEKNMPGVLDHPAYEQFKGMSLRALEPLSGGLITDEKIAALEQDLKAAQ